MGTDNQFLKKVDDSHLTHHIEIEGVPSQPSVFAATPNPGIRRRPLGIGMPPIVKTEPREKGDNQSMPDVLTQAKNFCRNHTKVRGATVSGTILPMPQNPNDHVMPRITPGIEAVVRQIEEKKSALGGR